MNFNEYLKENGVVAEAKEAYEVKFPITISIPDVKGKYMNDVAPSVIEVINDVAKNLGSKIAGTSIEVSKGPWKTVAKELKRIAKAKKDFVTDWETKNPRRKVKETGYKPSWFSLAVNDAEGNLVLKMGTGVGGWKDPLSKTHKLV